MKRIILSLLILFVSVISFAQENHLKFKGIPIDGDLDVFVTALKKEGFTHLRDDELPPNTAALTGTFTNRDANIIVGADDTKNVWKVIVFFQENESWKSLEDEYLRYKDMFTTKYGKPKHIEEKFKDKLSREYNMEMYALYQSNCKFASSWELDNGYITVSIEPFGTLKGCVVLQYEDSANSEKRSKNNLDDI